jgi:hypothetical protein
MNHVFVIQNSAGLFLTRQGEWVSREEATGLFKTPHHDLAINELFEATAKYSALRAVAVKVSTSSRGQPLVAHLPLPDIPGAATLQPASAVPEVTEDHTGT